MVKADFNVAEFAKSMLYNYIKVVRLKPDQPNQWLRACHFMAIHLPLPSHPIRMLVVLATPVKII